MADGEIYNSLNVDALKLAEPENFFNGLRIKKGFIPDNILMFCHDSSDLNKYYGYHHRFVLITPLKGEGKVGLDKKIVDVEPGKSVLIFPYQIHFYPEASSDCSWLYTTFEAEIVEKVMPLKESVRENDKAYEDTIAKMLKLFKQSDRDSDALELSSLLKGLVERMVKLPEFVKEQVHQPISPRVKNLLAEIEEYLNENISRAVPIQELADRYDLSKNYLSAVFRDTYGMTLGQYILRLRINHATILLLSTNLKVAEIAPRCGFESPISFGRSFKKIMKITPKQYRNTHKPQ